MDVKVIVKAAIIIVIVMVFFLVTIINLKVKKPESCEKSEKDTSCMGCVLPCHKNEGKK